MMSVISEIDALPAASPDRARAAATPASDYSRLAQFSSREDRPNPNYHLWQNNGTWFVHFTVYPSPFTKERVRLSLQTKCVETARHRRDALFAQYSTCPAAAHAPQ